MSRAKGILDILEGVGGEQPAQPITEKKVKLQEAKDVREVIQMMIDSLNKFNQQATVGEFKEEMMPELISMMKREEKAEQPPEPVAPSAPSEPAPSHQPVSDSNHY